MHHSDSIVNCSELLADMFPVSNELFMVDVKKLHLWLEVETRINDWFNRRVKYFGFAQDVDFILLKNEQNDIIDLRCTANMAKELGMLERSQKGAQIRRYFIDCEQLALEAVPLLKLRIQELEAQKGILQIEAKKPHKNLGTVPYYSPRSTLFSDFDLENRIHSYETRRVQRDSLREPELATQERIHCSIRLAGTTKELLKREAYEAAICAWEGQPSHVRGEIRKPQRRDFGLKM